MNLHMLQTSKMFIVDKIDISSQGRNQAIQIARFGILACTYEKNCFQLLVGDLKGEMKYRIYET